MIESILMISIVIGFTISTALIDAEHINKGEYVDDHSNRWLQRSYFLMIFLLLGLNYFFAAALMFTAIFDQTLNFLRKKPFWYLGDVAMWDIFFSKRKWLYITVKVAALITSIALFLI